MTTVIPTPPAQPARASTSRVSPVLVRAGLFWATWLALVVFLMTMRAIYLAWNLDVFGGFPAAKLAEAFAIGLRFDASAAGLLCAGLLPLALAPLGRRASGWRWSLYALVLGAITLPLFLFGTVDSELVRAVGRRTTVDSLFLYGESDWHALDIARQFAPLTLAGIVLMAAWVALIVRGRKWILRTEASLPSSQASAIRSWLWAAALLLLSVAVLVLAIRGGWSNSKPLSIVHTHPEPHLDNLALNTPFVLLKSLGRDKPQRMGYFHSRDELLRRLNGAAPAPSLLPSTATKHRPLNVVVIVMESLSLGYMGEVNGVDGYTPFIDGLVHRSLFFPNAWANAMRSIEGIPAVLGSVPALSKEPLLASPYASTQFEGLGTLLAQQGYDTAFFHAAMRGTMYLDQFAARAGFARYYSREDYPDPTDDDGAWGIFDEPYFQYVADQIGRMRQPFGVVAFSLTAHHPFKVPAKLAERFPDGPQPILKSIAYSDYALRRFFETAQTRPWYADTVFVITADHGFLPYLPQYKNDLGRWRIPLILFQPGRIWPQVDTRQPVSQIDIVPTIVDIIGARPATRNWLARSVFVPGERTVLLRAENSYFAIDGDYFLFYPLSGQPQLYRIDDPERRRPVSGHDDLRQRLIECTRAAVQYFNNGLLDATLVQPAPPS
jgi:phosphoglycerol transferase MdoB-like AlkP superfamily enzyme